MATTRKRARTTGGKFQADDPATTDKNEAWVDVNGLASFMALEHPDTDKLSKALELAKASAERITGKSLSGPIDHNLAQGIQLLASKLLISDELDEPPADAAIPLVARYYFRLASAQS